MWLSGVSLVCFISIPDVANEENKTTATAQIIRAYYTAFSRFNAGPQKMPGQHGEN